MNQQHNHQQNNTSSHACCDTTVAPAHSCCGSNDTAMASGASSYTCPMHPKVQQDKPGSCPECGMDLVPLTK
ncbi:MAG TPA: heavy metal-binding domain-containing protein [Candidatus Paceibacterota bacterium]